MKKSIQVLKSYFETGDQPTEDQYIDLIDSLAMPMIGEIKTVGFASVPSGWAKCDGQLLNITEYETLFNLLGTIYGGDGITTFALPNLQGRTMIHNDSTYGLGQIGGEVQNTLTENQLPAHSHDVGNLTTSHNLTGTVRTSSDDGVSDEPEANSFGVVSYNTGTVTAYNSLPFDGLMATDNVQIDGTVLLSGTTANTGNASPVNNMQPYLAVNTIIALEGIDPLVSS